MENIPTIQPRLSARLAHKGNAPVLKWIAPDLTRSKAFSEHVYVAQLDLDTEIGTTRYLEVENKIIDHGGKIIEKHSNRFEDTIVIDTSDVSGVLGGIDSIRRIGGIQALYPRPIPRAASGRAGDTRSSHALPNGLSAVTIPVGGVCSLEDTKNQASILDSVVTHPNEISNKGEGVHIVVWDFLPEDREAFKKNPDMANRAGGPPTIYDDETASTNMHGGAVCSSCCGDLGGLATKAKLSIIGITSSITGDLSIIDEICKEHKGPVVVNMSFALEFKNVAEGDRESTQKSMAILTDAFKVLKKRYRQLVFTVAAGNESLDVCDTKLPVSFSGCTDCYMWPQARLGTAYRWQDVPFIFVGATDAENNTKGKRSIASFSNHGKCVHVYAHGSPVCALDTGRGGKHVAIAGTSFSAPIFASMVALYFHKNPGASSDEATAYLIDKSTKGTIDAKSNQNVNNRFAMVPAALSEEGGGILPSIPGFDKAIISMKDDRIRFVMAILLIVVFIMILFNVYRKRKMKQRHEAFLASYHNANEKNLYP